MENEKPAVRGLTKSDVDLHGNVVLWDHGPQEPRDDIDRDSEEYQRLESEAKEWHRKHGRGPVPVKMHQSDATHAIAVEPLRYSLEPGGVSESEIEAEIEKIQEQRAEAEKVAADRAEAAQLVADRKTAIATVMARRNSPAPAEAESEPVEIVE